MPTPSSQKFIKRNRPPRVQIEYDVELYGAQRKIELPFIMGVLADLSGASTQDLPAVDQRKFLDIDIDNFDARLKSMTPRVKFLVPDKLSGEEGKNLEVDITFESMDDFSPAAIASKVEPLKKLLEARTELDNLLALMGGKSEAEKFISEQVLAKAKTLKDVSESGPETDTTAEVQ